jgi:hypothetical protein
VKSDHLDLQENRAVGNRSCHRQLEEQNMLYTTFNLLKQAGADQEGYGQFLLHKLKATANPDSPIPLTEILYFTNESLDNAIWSLRCCTEPEEAKSMSKLLAALYAEHMEHFYTEKYPDDPRVHSCNTTVPLYISGQTTMDELEDGARGAHAACVEASLAAWKTDWTPGKIVDGKWISGFAPNWSAPWAAAALARDAAWTAATNIVTEAAQGAMAIAICSREYDGDAERQWQSEKLKELLEQ